MAISTNTTAPVFTLKRKTAEGMVDYSLADNFGKKKTVLLFFPLSFTSVCENELCSVSAGMDAYAALSAEVWGISVDSPFAQEAFGQRAGIRIPLLSDFNKETAAAYGVLYDLLGFKGVAKRSAFVIDEAGSVIYSWSSDDPKVLPDFSAIQAALQ